MAAFRICHAAAEAYLCRISAALNAVDVINLSWTVGLVALVNKFLEGHVRPFSLAVAVFASISIPSAFAQYSAVVSSCNRDATAVCYSPQSETDRLAECIKTRFGELSEPCKLALVKISAVRDACDKDIQERCPTTELGAGRLLFCIKRQYSVLSERCKDAISHAAIVGLRR